MVMDLTDAALRERAQEIIDGGMSGERYTAQRRPLRRREARLREALRDFKGP